MVPIVLVFTWIVLYFYRQHFGLSPLILICRLRARLFHPFIAFVEVAHILKFIARSKRAGRWIFQNDGTQDRADNPLLSPPRFPRPLPPHRWFWLHILDRKLVKLVDPGTFTNVFRDRRRRELSGTSRFIPVSLLIRHSRTCPGDRMLFYFNFSRVCNLSRSQSSTSGRAISFIRRIASWLHRGILP